MSWAAGEEWREACEAAGGGATGSRALLVMAPSAGGKTTVVRRLADTLRLQGAVHVDGALVRECHEQWRGGVQVLHIEDIADLPVNMHII